MKQMFLRAQLLFSAGIINVESETGRKRNTMKPNNLNLHIISFHRVCNELSIVAANSWQGYESCCYKTTS